MNGLEGYCTTLIPPVPGFTWVLDTFQLPSGMVLEKNISCHLLSAYCMFMCFSCIITFILTTSYGVGTIIISFYREKLRLREV